MTIAWTVSLYLYLYLHICAAVPFAPSQNVSTNCGIWMDHGGLRGVPKLLKFTKLKKERSQ